ncbi:hypothetical protein [Intestinibacter sp.]
MNKAIKETRYCIVLKQAKKREKECAYGIEKIFVKSSNQEEIRFVYFKDTLRKKDQLIARPLDLPEADLIELIKEAIKKNVFSKEFVNSLKEVVNN